MSPPTAPIAVVSWPSRSAWVESISTRRVMLYWALGVTANGAPCAGAGTWGQHSQPDPGARSILAAVPDTAAPPATGPLLLIDGNSLAYRAFHALPDTISTADGFPTNALYGLAAMMMKMLAEERPGPGRGGLGRPGAGPSATSRSPTYKANRQATPDLFREQAPHFRPMMEAFGFVNTELTGFEADDVIGTLARRAEEGEEPVVILTGDRDAFQLVSPTGSA